ncbi:hypothetical protein HHK36_002428 [Tetracentron sinense]|uniref:Pentatricopeptide repeat-containing protein n=1 Tax=Tetracentron sinense TaxID=13715 RepID=A0A835DR49_TETSI|nr:hypothetical protein HHK36_002428 [Tetracentron sinense]
MPVKDVVSWNSMIMGYIRHGDLDSARSYFNHAPERSLVSWNSMVAGYACSGRIEEVEKLFREMPVMDTSWNSLISGYVKVGVMISAKRIFERMPERDAVSWTAMIDGYTRNGHYDSSLRLFQRMQLAKIGPTEVNLLSILTSCTNLGALELVKRLHNYIHKNGFIIDNNLGTALINMYAKCGEMDSGLEGLEVF